MPRYAGWMVLIGFLAFGAAGCATKRPVLYENTHLQSVGRTQSEKDIDECFEMASKAGLEARPAEKAVKRSAEAGAVGAAAGVAAGAVSRSETAGTGAGAGAAGAAAGTLAHSVFRVREPDPIQKRFIEECLRDKGYRVIGWR